MFGFCDVLWYDENITFKLQHHPVGIEHPNTRDRHGICKSEEILIDQLTILNVEFLTARTGLQHVDQKLIDSLQPSPEEVMRQE